ncbi:MAG: YciI family protein [Roseibium sp.]
MFVVTLKFSENKSHAGALMAGHKDWIQRGFDQGLFLMVGSLQPNQGGVVFAHNTSRDTLDAFVQEDPFVAEKVVVAEVMEISPARLDDRLDFLTA